MKKVVAYVTAHHGYSERRACALTHQHRSTQRKPAFWDPRLEIRQRMHEIVQTRIRYGYRRVHIMLMREGWVVGRNLVYRLYREDGLALRSKRSRRLPVTPWPGMQTKLQSNPGAGAKFRIEAVHDSEHLQRQLEGQRGDARPLNTTRRVIRRELDQVPLDHAGHSTVADVDGLVDDQVEAFAAKSVQGLSRPVNGLNPVDELLTPGAFRQVAADVDFAVACDRKQRRYGPTWIVEALIIRVRKEHDRESHLHAPKCQAKHETEEPQGQPAIA
jgi:hypothetical protein